jgi:hypothetical protein
MIIIFSVLVEYAQWLQTHSVTQLLDIHDLVMSENKWHWNIWIISFFSNLIVQTGLLEQIILTTPTEPSPEIWIQYV